MASELAQAIHDACTQVTGGHLGPGERTDVAAFKAELAGIEARLIEAQVQASALLRESNRLRLVLLGAQGQGESDEARWLRAWLAGDYAEAERLTAIRYPASTQDTISRLQHALSECGQGCDALTRCSDCPEPEAA